MPPVAELAQKAPAPDAPGRIVVPFEVKAVDEGERTFSGLAAVWDLDLGDDVIHKGAFKEALEEWRKSKKAMPLLNSHNHFDIFSALGQMLEAKEAKAGLDTDWEVIEGPDGDRVMSRLRPSKRTGRALVGSMSIGYTPLKFDFEESDAARWGQIRHLRKVGLKEVSLVLFPMAPGALIDLGSVKAMIAQGRAQPEDLEALQRYSEELGEALKGGPPPAMSEADEGPDSTKLDALRVQRMRLLARRS